MDFLGIGPGEILLIIVVALLLWGPGRIVEIARTFGKVLHTIRKEANGLTSQLTTELEEQKKEHEHEGER